MSNGSLLRSSGRSARGASARQLFAKRELIQIIESHIGFYFIRIVTGFMNSNSNISNHRL